MRGSCSQEPICRRDAVVGLCHFGTVQALHAAVENGTIKHRVPHSKCLSHCIVQRSKRLRWCGERGREFRHVSRYLVALENLFRGKCIPIEMCRRALKICKRTSLVRRLDSRFQWRFQTHSIGNTKDLQCGATGTKQGQIMFVQNVIAR